MTQTCIACTFDNILGAKVCEICETQLDSNLFHERWQKAKVLVIGAVYDKQDSDFWSILDENYIGIGIGSHPFEKTVHWQTDWKQDNFWSHSVPIKEIGFKYIFLDRCVWNIVIHYNFQEMLRFIHVNLQVNGCLCIPQNNWTSALDCFTKNQFITAAKQEYKRCLENQDDVKAVEDLMKFGHFMMINDFSSFHDKETENSQDRMNWKAFIKMRPFVKK